MTPIRYIQIATADQYEITREDIIGPSRRRAFARPRMLAMYLAHTHTDKSLNDIGDAFAGRDHTTILNGIRKTEARMDAEIGFDCHAIMKRADRLWEAALRQMEREIEERAAADFFTTQRHA